MHILAQDVYSNFPVPPNLALHQIRVASIVYFVLTKLDKDAFLPVSAALLHDLGNLAKFNLSSLDDVEFCKDEACLRKWQNIQNKIHKEIGKDTDNVTIAFLKQAKINKKIINFLQEIFYFDFDENNLDNLSFAQKTLIYADMRTAPYGITTLKQRNDDSRKRYAKNPNSPFGEEDFKKFEKIGQIIEKEIQLKGINTKEISDTNLKTIQNDLYNFKIPLD